MHTPGHMIINWTALGKKPAKKAVAFAAAFGGLAPDIPIYLFYLWAKLQGVPEKTIWTDKSFRPAYWQDAIDYVHSVPLAALIVAIGAVFKRPWIAVLGASMFLHDLCDFLTHHDDGHRHFLPFTQWKFESPVSYWNPQYYGHAFGVFEIALIVTLSTLLWRRHQAWLPRVFIFLFTVFYVLPLIFMFKSPFS